MPKRSKATQAIVDKAKTMPPLFHKLPDSKFDIRKSRVVWWLIKQPEVLNYIWNDIVQPSGAVVYDRESGKWKGVDFDGDDDE